MATVEGPENEGVSQLRLRPRATLGKKFRQALFVSQSSHAENFVIKGATLFHFWTGEMHRPTRDLDLLGFGDSSDGSVAETKREIVALINQYFGHDAADILSGAGQ